MTGMTVEKVNIHVEGVSFEKENEALSEEAPSEETDAEPED